MKRRYITAFPGRRDSYQIPLALSESGRLAAFLTCFYRQKGLLGRMKLPLGPWSRQFEQRHSDGLKEARIVCLEFSNLASRFGQRIFQPSKVGVWEDNAFARKAVALARADRASLLLYEFQADWAFRQPLKHDAAKILFQFHPHPDLEHPLLLADGSRYPQFLPAIRRNTRSNLSACYRNHTREAWRLANHVIVASHFTARSLQTAGCPAEKISVVPYGCSFVEASAETGSTSRPLDKPYFLFVGSGTHRKGLHHLLEAWSQCNLLATHELVVIARVVDPELQGVLATTKSVRHLAGVSPADLVRWFSSAQAFVLPSLSEGFGHVFLEALACGCPVIGTKNTMLPDFVEAQPHVRYVEPGNPDHIRAEIERVGRLPSGDIFFCTESVRQSVRNYTWKKFRDGIEAVLSRFD
jgi:glycosyltransferase involved in cell wall biosynthesis